MKKHIISGITVLLFTLGANAQADMLQELTAKAEGGDPEAISDLGFHYLGFEELEELKDETPKAFYERVKALFAKAKAAGNEDAEIGYDHAEAILDLIAKAESGDEEAQFDLAYAFDEGEIEYSGINIVQSYERAMHWYKKAAKQDHLIAINNIGVMHAKGQGVPVSSVTAVKWYRRAAVKGYGLAQENLAYMYQDGDGVKQSDRNAAKWFKKAAKQDYSDAQYELGNAYLEGRGVEQSTKKAVEWIEKAAAQDNEEAQNAIGLMYLNGQGVPANETVATEWLEQSAEQGHTPAYYNLGRQYLKQKRYEEAVEWLEAAADNNNAAAMSSLGNCYYNGLGVEKSYERAIELFKQAAEVNNADAMYYMGTAYREGHGVEANNITAYAWLSMAIENDEVSDEIRDRAQTSLDTLKKDLSESDKLKAEAEFEKIVEEISL